MSLIWCCLRDSPYVTLGLISTMSYVFCRRYCHNITRVIFKCTPVLVLGEYSWVAYASDFNHLRHSSTFKPADRLSRWSHSKLKKPEIDLGRRFPGSSSLSNSFPASRLHPPRCLKSGDPPTTSTADPTSGDGGRRPIKNALGNHVDNKENIRWVSMFEFLLFCPRQNLSRFTVCRRVRDSGVD